MLLPAGARLLAQAKAGRVIRDGKSAQPDARKGFLRVIRTEDGLVHLQWLVRDAGDAAADAEPEVDVIVFPDEASFIRPEKAPPRVVMLKFRDEPDRDALFWLQEPSEAGDAALCARVDKAINAPLGVDDGDADEFGADAAGGLQEVAADALLRGHVSDAPGAGDVVTAGDSVGLVPSAPGQQPLAPAQLAALLSGMAGGGGGAAGGGAAAGDPGDPGASLAAALLAAMARRQQQQQQRELAVAPGPGLAEVLRPEVLAPLLQDQEVLERLASHLPEQHRSPAALAALAHSPQFHQQLAAFSAALQTGQLDLAQFGLNPEGFSVADFLRAIESLVERERGGGGGGQEQA